VTLTPHPLLVPRSKNKVELLTPLYLTAFMAYIKCETYLQYKLGRDMINNGKHVESKIETDTKVAEQF
jgi:hypothetical protein